MPSLGVLEDCPTVNANGSVTLLVKQAGSATGDALERGLRAAGLPLVVATNPFDTVTQAARRGSPVRYLVVGVDFYDAETFRLLPLFRREWPTTTIIAYHSPGFEHKGRIARLVGADVVLSEPAGLIEFLGSLSRGGPPASVTRPEAPRPAEPPAPAVHEESDVLPAPARPPAEAAHAPPVAAQAPAAQPLVAPIWQPEHETGRQETPPSPRQEVWPEPALRQPPAPPPADHTPAPEPRMAAPAPAKPEIENLDDDRELEHGRVIGSVELTDEELRILLGEDDET